VRLRSQLIPFTSNWINFIHNEIYMCNIVRWIFRRLSYVYYWIHWYPLYTSGFKCVAVRVAVCGSVRHYWRCEAVRGSVQHWCSGLRQLIYGYLRIYLISQISGFAAVSGSVCYTVVYCSSVAVCGSVRQCAAVCGSVRQCAEVCESVRQCGSAGSVWQCGSAAVKQRVRHAAVCSCARQCVAVRQCAPGGARGISVR
jgi:hypothetical protein